MDFHQYVREHLPPLAIAREPEIVDELAQHLSDLNAEARDAGLNHEAALARAAAALPEYPEDLAREIESASRSLPGLIADRWCATLHEPVIDSPRGGFSSMFSDFRRDLRYAVRMLARTPATTVIIFLTLARHRRKRRDLHRGRRRAAAQRSGRRCVVARERLHRQLRWPRPDSRARRTPTT